MLESEEQANFLDKLDRAELKLVLHYIEFLQEKGLVRRWGKTNLDTKLEKRELKLVSDFIAFMHSIEKIYQSDRAADNRELARLADKIKRMDTAQVKMMLYVVEFIEEEVRVESNITKSNLITQILEDSQSRAA